MKKHAIIIAILLCLSLCACNTSNFSDASDNSSPENENTPASPRLSSLNYDSFSDLKNSMNKESKDTLCKKYTKEGATSARINKINFFTEKFKSQNIIVPYLGGKVIELRNEEGFSNITFFPVEAYDLPCIFYHPKVSTGENFYIKMTYIPDSITEKQENITASEVRKELSPNGPNINNLGSHHKSIYNQKIQLGNREVITLIIEYKTDNRNSTIFVYDDLLVEVRSDPNVWGEKWFSSLTFDGFHG